MPRTLAQNAQYIAETIKPAIKSAIEAQGVTVPSTDSFLDYADRIGEIEGGGSGYQLKDLPTGSISTVNDAAELPLNALKVSVEAWQEGSGDPSPSNIRPIHGWSSGEISVVGKNLLPCEATSATTFGMQFDVLSDKKVYVEKVGTHGQPSFCNYGHIYLKTGTYKINGVISGSGSTFYVEFLKNSYTGTRLTYITNGDNDLILTEPTEVYVRLVIASNGLQNLGDNTTFAPMIRLATEAATTYEPYQGKQYTQQFPQTIYGAEWDVIEGRYINSIIYYEKTEVEYYGLYGDDNAPLFYFDVSGIKPYINDGDPVTIMSNIYKSYPSLTSESMPNNCIRTRYSAVPTRIYFRDDRFTSKAEINAWLANNPLQVKCELMTPTTIDLSPLSIRLLEGTNNIYADCGEVIEGEYFVDEGAIDVRKVDYQIGSSGSIKTTDGRVLSGFVSMSGYHARPLDASGNWLDVDWSKSFEIGIAFKYTVADTNQTLFGSGISGAQYYKCPMIMLHPASQQFEIDISTTGNSWDITMSQTVTYASLTINTWYFLKMTFNQSDMSLVIQISNDFSTWDTLLSITMSAAYYHDAASLCFGGFVQNSSFSSNNLLIDTFNTYIKGNGVNWGASTGVFPR